APTGERFHAPLHAPSIPAALGAEITAVTGFDDWSRRHVSAIRSQHGVTPQDIEGFYDITGLVGQHVDGSGMTVVLPEIDSFNQSDLDAFASRNGLPPFQVDVHRNGRWGNPDPPADEANMDLEIVHAMAPAARLVVYYSSPKDQQVLSMLQAMFGEQAGPTTIVSSSIGTCETPDANAAAQTEES